MSKKIINSMLVAVMLLTGCSANEQASIPDTTTISEVETITIMTDNKVAVKELVAETYSELNNVYKNCSLYTELISANTGDPAERDLANIKHFTVYYPIPYTFISAWIENFCIKYAQIYNEEFGNPFGRYLTRNQELIEQQQYIILNNYNYCLQIIYDYLIEIEYYSNIENSLAIAQQNIEEINNLEISENCINELTSYYELCSSYYQLTQNAIIDSDEFRKGNFLLIFDEIETLDFSDFSLKVNEFLITVDDLNAQIEALKLEIELYIS